MNKKLEQKKQDDTKVSIASTACANCIFAEHENRVQIGCAAGRLEKFRKADVNLVPIANEEDITSFLIDGKTCVYYRNNKWAKSYYKSSSVDKIIKSVKAELKIPYHVLLFLRSDDSLDDVGARLSELESQDVKPKIVTLIDRSHSTKIMTGDLMKICQKYSFAHWRIQSIQAIDQLDNDVIDLAYDNTKKMNYMFYTVLECGYEIPQKMSADIHKSLHDDMESFVILSPNSQNVGKTILKVAHEKYGGNSFTIPLEDKIVHYDDAAHLIRGVEEICPSLRVS
ncbi:hypothetical protein CL634_01335 [bacterium]|nr:hypothetical protein [bacterium]